MLTRNKVWGFGLVDLMTGLVIDIAGGIAFVCTHGSPALATLYNPSSGAALSNPISATRGKFSFATAETVETVDLFILSPTGHFMTFIGMKAQEYTELKIDMMKRDNVAVIPFSVNNSGVTAATEFDTGFDFPLKSMILPFACVETATLDESATIDVGLLSSETSGDADGIIDGASVATAVIVPGTLANSGITLGALLRVQDSANSGDLVPRGHVVQGANAKSLTFTLSSGADTAEGYIHVPYTLLGLSSIQP